MCLNKNNILVIDLTFYPAQDANTLCALRILKNQPGYNITVVSEKGFEDETETEEYEGLRIHRINVNSFRRDLKKLSSVKDAAALALHSAGYINAKIRNRKNYGDINFDRVNNYLREITSVVAINDFDIIISFANPIESHYCAWKLAKKYKKPWVAYYFDPYYCNASKSEKGLKQRIRLEKNILLKADSIIVPGFFLDEMVSGGLVRNRERIKKVELPGIRPIREVTSNGQKTLPSNKVNCVFVGNLYWKIRNPVNVMQAFGKLKDGIALYFVGGCFDGDILEILKQNDITVPPNVHFLGKVRPEVADEYLCQADILVNIGNTVSNQLPSKVFDYISAGKPIVNIYKIEDCPSIRYFARYPLSLSIYEKNLEKAEYIEKLYKFCLSHKGRHMEYSDIESLFKDAAVKYVRKSFIEQVEATLQHYRK